MKTEIKSLKSRKAFNALDTLKGFHGTDKLHELEGKEGYSYDRTGAYHYTVENGKLYVEEVRNIRW